MTRRARMSDGVDGGSSLGACSPRFVILVLVLSNILVFQVGRTFTILSSSSSFETAPDAPVLSSHDHEKATAVEATVEQATVEQPTVEQATVEQATVEQAMREEPKSSVSIHSSSGGGDRLNPIQIPQGEAVALPSIRLSEEENKNIKREFYGGDGDGAHLGGFTDIDLMGISPSVWKFMVEYLGIKSIVDLGCGRGISTSWFLLHGIETICAEGSHDAIEKSMVPNKEQHVVEHDFSRGPWWPSRTVDAMWCIEFTEHVERNYIPNYLPTLRKAAFIIISHSHWGGWHHVEVHSNEWWITRWESFGFVYSSDLTDRIKKTAKQEKNEQIVSPTGKNYNAQHLWTTVQVFINPLVASLPEHAHLLAQHGCFTNRDSPNKPCPDSPLPESFLPLKLTKEMDDAWTEHVKKHIST